MSDCSHGPVMTMPGHEFKCPTGTLCDTNHEDGDRIAVKRIQGETDSMGCEYVDLCQECFDDYQKRDLTEESTGKCDRCGYQKTTLRKRRDYDEGLCGPIYNVCLECVIEENGRFEEEFNDHDDDY